MLTAEVKPDDLEDDNKFDKVVLVRDKVRVLVVDGSPNDRDPEKAGSYFLAHALLPVPEEFRSQYHVQPSVVRATDVGPGSLSDKEVCVLVNCPLGGAGALPADFVQRLDEFVKEGHGLLITAWAERREDRVQPIDRRRGIEPVADGTVRPVRRPKGYAPVPGPELDRRESFLARFKLSANHLFLQLLRRLRAAGGGRASTSRRPTSSRIWPGADARQRRPAGPGRQSRSAAARCRS